LSYTISLVVLLLGSLDITVIIEAQRAIWYIAPLLPMFLVFFIGSIAETNRVPFLFSRSWIRVSEWVYDRALCSYISIVNYLYTTYFNLLEDIIKYIFKHSC
jgi:hypothetical protein